MSSAHLPPHFLELRFKLPPCMGGQSRRFAAKLLEVRYVPVLEVASLGPTRAKRLLKLQVERVLELMLGWGGLRRLYVHVQSRQLDVACTASHYPPRNRHNHVPKPHGNLSSTSPTHQLSRIRSRISRRL